MWVCKAYRRLLAFFILVSVLFTVVLGTRGTPLKGVVPKRTFFTGYAMGTSTFLYLRVPWLFRSVGNANHPGGFVYRLGCYQRLHGPINGAFGVSVSKMGHHSNLFDSYFVSG